MDVIVSAVQSGPDVIIDGQVALAGADQRNGVRRILPSDHALALFKATPGIMLYWLPNTGASSVRLYWEAMQAMRNGGMPAAPMPTPAGISMFPGEQLRLSRRWAERRFARLIHFNEPERGGHFAALERPAAFVDEVRATFRSLRAGSPR